MSSVSTHVLDAVEGVPGAGIDVQLVASDGAVLAVRTTDTDGRTGRIEGLAAGTYQLVFATAAYSDFFPAVTITFVVADDQHYHVPLLLSHYAYSTYRGS